MGISMSSDSVFSHFVAALVVFPSLDSISSRFFLRATDLQILLRNVWPRDGCAAVEPGWNATCPYPLTCNAGFCCIIKISYDNGNRVGLWGVMNKISSEPNQSYVNPFDVSFLWLKVQEEHLFQVNYTLYLTFPYSGFEWGMGLVAWLGQCGR